MHGQGGTGKSTFREALSATLGDYAGVADLKTFTTADSPHSASPDLARLRGLRMVVVGEVTSAPVGSLSLLKQITGGDKVQARFLWGQPFEFLPTFTLWLVGNQRPCVSDSDSGIWRRMREIPFLTRFPQPDPTVRTILKNDPKARTAILNWATEGCKNWQQYGLGRLPNEVEKATADYKADTDPLREWLDDNTHDDLEAWASTAAMYLDYLGWARDSGVRRPLRRETFGKRLSEWYTPERCHMGRGFAGIALGQIQRDGSRPTRRYNDPIPFPIESSHEGTFGNQPSQPTRSESGQIELPTVTPNRDGQPSQLSQPSRLATADPWDLPDSPP
ncbi:MAG: hypothetical protein HY531_00370 [Chloroflexi bacterium]|nr:hypothetical protein [Chloroflexota bacterium]